MTLSIVPTRYQDGIVFHAGTPEVCGNALRANARWVDARTAPLLGGRSLAKHDGKRLGLTYRSKSPPVNGTKLKTVVGSPERHDGDWPAGGGTLDREARDSPWSGAKASM